MVTFILVHGTFASEAKWPQAGSPLRECLMSAAEAARIATRFERVVWSGKNQLAERRRASQRIAELVKTAPSDERFILIGHSHGGSAIAYYLRQFGVNPERVIGCIFLSTPFLALRERAGAKRLGPAAILLLWLAWLVFVSPMMTRNYGIIANAVEIVVVVGMCLWASNKLWSATNLTLSDQIAEQQTADLPCARYLFLRASGDEAAAGLSFAQFSLWASTKLSRLFLRRVSSLTDEQGGLFIFRLVASLFVLNLCVVSSLRYYDPVVTTMIWKLASVDSIVALSLLLLMIALYGLACAITLTFCVFVFLTVAWTLIQASASRAFGWTGFVDGLLLDMAVEPLPFGVHKLDHVPWNSIPGASDYTHSWTYENPTALARMREWTAMILAGNNHTGTDRIG